ncbi:MAG: hypothetical protein WDN04_20695 [Rhodospirillales bacterium]
MPGTRSTPRPAPVAGQNLSRIRWSTPVDLNPQVEGGGLFIHYASPMITPNNAVLLAVKTGATDGWQMEAHLGASGKRIWTTATDYVLPPATSWDAEFSGRAQSA